MQNVKKKFLKEIKKSKKISWQNPLKIAQKISQNYQENWVFLYSALHQEKPNSKSYIAIFENQKYRGSDFEELQKIIKNRAEFKARLIIKEVNKTMELEDQKIENSENSVKLLTKDFAENLNKNLWRNDEN